ncbi:MAG: alkaline phosphatase family protein [Acidobacteria bacterium]|nr:alkaline phosphatase family protein [Acidobacteriota bacterium]
MIRLHSPQVRRAVCLALATALLSLPFAAATAAQPRPARGRPPAPPAPSRAAQTARPRLVLLVVVDQFRADFLERFGDLFAANGGLRRLTTRGGVWDNANYDHAPTYTAPGHATTMTGTWPAENGIIGNLWYDREAGRVVENISDPDDQRERPRYQLFGGGPRDTPASPRRMTPGWTRPCGRTSATPPAIPTPSRTRSRAASTSPARPSTPRSTRRPSQATCSSSSPSRPSTTRAWGATRTRTF